VNDALKLRFEDDSKVVKAFVVTDFTLERREPTNPHTLPRQLLKSARNGLPGRAYAKSFRHELVGKAVRIHAFFPFSEEDRRRMKEFEAQGKRIEFVIPKGTPIFVRPTG
jgi:hypothetical protein